MEFINLSYIQRKQYTCNICYEDCNRIEKCLGCQKVICLKCIVTINKYVCTFCDRILSTESLIYLHDVAKTNIYRYYFINKTISAYNGLTDHIILRYINMKNLKYGIYDTSIDYHSSGICKKNNCNGNIIKETNICNICKTKYCKKCKEVSHEGEECNKEILSTLKYLSENTKQCPVCSTPIEKIPLSCNDMKCVACGSYFNWRNLYIDRNKNSNTHYDDIEIKYEVIYNNYLNKYKILNIKPFSLKTIYHTFKACNTFKNNYSKILKKKVKYEYLFLTRPNIDEKFIEKLFDIYKGLEYYGEVYKIYDKCSASGDIIERINCLKRNKLYPKKLLYTLNSNCNLIKPKNKFIDINKIFGKINVYTAKENPTYGDVSKVGHVLERIKKNKIYINYFDNYDTIIQVFLNLSITNLTIICSKLASLAWDKAARNYNISIHYIIVQNKHKLNTIPSSINKFLCNSGLIIDINKSIKNLFNITYINLITNSFINIDAHIYIITNNESLDIIETKLLSYYGRNDDKLFKLLKNIPKEKFLDLLLEYGPIIYKDKVKISKVYNKIFVNSNRNYIKINDRLTIDPSVEFFRNHKSDFITYAVKLSSIYQIYRIDYMFYIYIEHTNKLIYQDHKRACSPQGYCIYCDKCCIDKNLYKHMNPENISVCCFIHSLPYIDTNIETIGEYKRLSRNISHYYEDANFTPYETNLIFGLDICYLLKVLKHYLVNSFREPKKFINYNISFNIGNKKNKYMDRYAVTDYILDHTLPIYLYIRDFLIYEQKRLPEMVNFIENQTKNKIRSNKYIITVCFNENLKDLLNLLETKDNIRYICKNTSNRQKVNRFNEFANNNQYNVLIITTNTELPNIQLKLNNIINVVHWDIKCNSNEKSQKCVKTYYNFTENLYPILYNKNNRYVINYYKL
jgi:hypothetical protein